MIRVSERDDHLIIYNDGTILSRINDEYNRLKFKHYEGNRIFYKFSDDAHVQETYDDRIFNCIYNGETLQIREANDLAKVIKEHDADEYANLFKRCYYAHHKTRLIKELVANSFNTFSERVRLTSDERFIIDDRFMVDQHATAHVYGTATDKKKNEHWKFLCIVVKSLRAKRVRTPIGEIELDTKLVEILAKINFLLKPKTTDNVFMSQLPKSLQTRLIREEKEFCK